MEWEMATYPSMFCLEKFYGQQSLVGYSSFGCKESDTIEWISMDTNIFLYQKYYYILYVLKTKKGHFVSSAYYIDFLVFRKHYLINCDSEFM